LIVPNHRAADRAAGRAGGECQLYPARWKLEWPKTQKLRITGRGTHQAPFSEAAAIDIANAYINAVYLDNDGDETYFGLSEAQFAKALNSNSLVWAPDGDEAFDDGSYVLQFDVGDRVRLVAFKRPDRLVDPASVREVFLPADTFYSTLRQWRDQFMTEWESLPKHDWRKQAMSRFDPLRAFWVKWGFFTSYGSGMAVLPGCRT
jgi:hypothetical protein